MRSLLWKLLAAAGIAILFATSAQAQATRTWVSGVGDDANPCSRTAPCKTFAGAISKTATNGEINCIDSGGFGAVTITKSITIDCGGTFGSVLNPGTNGIIINTAGAVTIRNLSMDGAGTGINGIRIVGGATVLIEKVRIFGNTNLGIDVEPASGSAKVFITDTTVHGNANGGILLKPPAGASVNASLTRVNMYNNKYGLRAEDRSKASVFQSVADGNIGNGFLAFSATEASEVNIVDSMASNTTTNGVASFGTAATLRLLNSAIFNNGTGISNSGAAVVGTTPGSSLNAGNGTDGAVSTTVPLQ